MGLLSSLNQYLQARKADKQMQRYFTRLSKRLANSFRLHVLDSNELTQLEDWIGQGGTHHLKKGVVDRLFLMPQMMEQLLLHGAKPSENLPEYIHEYLIKKASAFRCRKDLPRVEGEPKGIDEWFIIILETLAQTFPHYNWHHSLVVDHQKQVLSAHIEEHYCFGFLSRLKKTQHQRNIEIIPQVLTPEQATEWLSTLFRIHRSDDSIFEHLIAQKADVCCPVYDQNKKVQPLAVLWEALWLYLVKNGWKFNEQSWLSFCVYHCNSNAAKALTNYMTSYPGLLKAQTTVVHPFRGEEISFSESLFKHFEEYDDVKAELEKLFLNEETAMCSDVSPIRRL